MYRVVLFSLVALACCSRAEVLSSGGCDNALVIPGPYNGQLFFGATTNAPTYDNMCNLDSDSGTYFMIVTPEPNTPMSITTCYTSTTFDTVLAVYQGGDCGSLECVASNDNTTCTTASASTSSVNFTPTGGSYWVMVAGHGDAEGQFEITFTQETAFEYSCESAIAIQGPFTTPLSIFGWMTGMTTDDEQPCDVASTSIGNWYIIYPTPNAVVTVTTCGDYINFDTVLAVLVGDSCYDLSCVSFNDNDCRTFENLSTVTFTADDSAFYYVYVTGNEAAYGSYYLTISEKVR